MKRSMTIFSLMFALLVCGCSYVDEADRFIEVEKASVTRAVLVEDFTGQRCINCPNAAEEIERLQQQYGEENVVAVSIHSGPLAVYPSGQVTGLRTALGDTYYDYWKVEAEPSGLINRKGGVVFQNQWQALVFQELQQPTQQSITIACEKVTPAKANITIDVSTSTDVKAKLQVWLTEDSIVAPQMMPDGTMNADYIHHHVLRVSANGDWGDDIALNKGKSQTYPYTMTLSPEWDADHLYIVAFIYNDEGVLQVCRNKIK